MISLYDLLEAANGQLFGEAVSKVFTGFCYDARHIVPGQLYATVRTERGDGHRFIEEAIAGGATGIICVRPPNIPLDGITCLVVGDVVKALSEWTAYILDKFGTTVIGITGGPSAAVTQAAIARVLQDRYRVFTSEADCQGLAALPTALSSLERDHDFAILAIESDYPSQMAEMVTIIRPMVGVVTEAPGHPTAPFSEDYLEFIKRLPPDGLAVLNYDHAHTRAMRANASAPVLTFGLDASGIAYGADLTAYNIRRTRYRTSFDLRYSRQRMLGRWVRLLGARQLYSGLAALLVGQAYGVPLPQGLDAISELPPRPGRRQPLEGIDGSYILDDSYDTTTKLTLELLDWLEAIRESEPEDTRIVLALGDIAPAGQHTAGLARRIAQTADRYIGQGHAAARLGRAAAEQGMQQMCTSFSHADTIACIRDGLDQNDLVVVSGTAQTGMERVVRGLLRHPADTQMLIQRQPVPRPPHLHVLGEACRAWVEIDLSAIADNLRQVQRIVGPEVAIMAVLQADAYGHGAAAVGAAAAHNGAAYLGVSAPEDGIVLRRAGVEAPILILGHTPGHLAHPVIQHRLTATIFDLDTAQAFAKAAQIRRTTARVHFQVDSGIPGIAQVGIPSKEAIPFFRRVLGIETLEKEGLCTQLIHRSTEDLQKQITALQQIVNTLVPSGVRFRYVHAANTTAALAVPESRFSMVRVGSALYGLTPAQVTLPAGFRPALRWKTRIVQVKPEQDAAVIPLGPADGLHTGWPVVLVRGSRAAVTTSIDLNHTALDVSNVPGVQATDEVVLLGRQEEAQITAEEVAEALKLSSSTLLSGIMPHTPGSRVVIS